MSGQGFFFVRENPVTRTSCSSHLNVRCTGGFQCHQNVPDDGFLLCYSRLKIIAQDVLPFLDRAMK